jgi:hypothetical protein
MSSLAPVVIVIVIIVAAYFLSRSRVESFVSAVPIEITMEQYAQDLRVLASYVGPYIGEIYNYLRGMYSDPSQPSTMQFSYQPASVLDKQLQDPLLPVARAQVKAWIDSAKVQIQARYGLAFIKGAEKQHDLRYETLANGVLHVMMIKDGQSQTYLL